MTTEEFLSAHVESIVSEIVAYEDMYECGPRRVYELIGSYMDAAPEVRKEVAKRVFARLVDHL
jgi:hypothetical protein